MKFFEKKETNSPQPMSPVPQTGTPSQPFSVEAKPPVAPQRVSQTVLGSSVFFKGDLKAEENITIHGSIEGTIETAQDVVVGAEGRVRAGIRAANIVVSGQVIGNITATNKVELTSSGRLQGDIRAPKLSIAETALFKGSIDMNQPVADSEKPEKAEKKEKKVSSSASPELAKQ